MEHIDIIILSDAKTSKLHQVTLDCINSLLQSKGKEYFNIIVVEGNKEIAYENATTLRINEPFNYNRYMNIAIKQCNSQWIAACNNDLIFKKDWFVELMKYKYASMSPKSMTTGTQSQFKSTPTKGYRTARELSGWCIVLKRDVWNTINGFDESITFWTSDDAYREQLLINNIEHYIIPTSIVNHLEGGSNTLKTLDKKENEALTFDQVKVFNKLYNQNLFNLN